MIETNMMRGDGDSENFLSLVEKTSCNEEGTKGKATEKRRLPEESILRINRQKERELMEAIIEKDKRLKQLEKETNGYKTQHKEGIYWLQLQLNSTRKEKNAADERIAELEKELRNLTTLEKQSRKPSMHSTIVDSVEGGDEKDDLIAQLQSRLQMYESSFGAMEDQMAMVKASSGEVVKTLKKEIADLMEDHTRSELELLNQLSELENENRRRQLEHTLELHNKDETIEALRNHDTHSTSANQQHESVWTLVYDESLCTENTKNSTHASEIYSGHQANDCSATLIRTEGDQSQLVLRLEEENTELQQKLDKAKKELKDLQSSLKTKHDSEQAPKFSDERRAIDLSLDKLKTTMGSTNDTVFELKRLVKVLQTSNPAKEKKRILSVLDSASLINEEIKLSILLTELKLRNEFECLKKNRMVNMSQDHTEFCEEQLIFDLKNIQSDALVELETAEAEFSIQMKELERRVKAKKMNLDDSIQRHTQERVKKYEVQPEDGLDPLDCTESSCDRINISCSVLNLLEKELLQYAERIKAKNKKIGVLKQELHDYKSREKRLRKELRESVRAKGRGRTKDDKNNLSTKFDDALKEIGETCEDDGKDSQPQTPIPREVHTTTGDQPIVSPVASPFPSEHKRMGINLRADLKRGRRGRSADSRDAGADPAVAPIHLLTPGKRAKAIRVQYYTVW